jgi:Chain length determinant protein.
MENSNFKPDNIRQDAVNLVSLFRTIWDGRWLISKITLWFLFGGLILAFVIPKEYTAVTVMVPQISDPKSKLGGLSGLAAMAGSILTLPKSRRLHLRFTRKLSPVPTFSWS